MKTPKVLISVHGYAGDQNQIELLRPLYEHHGLPVVIVSPEDSPITKMGPHICRSAGKRAYVGQLSWDRQHEHMKLLLGYDFDWFLMHDSDSVCLEPKLPDYLFQSENTLWANVVDDFRKPGETYITDSGESITWPKDYHAGFPILAAQPPYFCHRRVLEKLVSVGPGQACPITPFIDWQMIYLSVKAGVEIKNFHGCAASCETVSSLGRAVMRECIVVRGATFVHAIKSVEARDHVIKAYKERKGL